MLSNKVVEEDKLLELQMTDEQFNNVVKAVDSSKKEKNPRSYERFRGRAGKEQTKAMSYYLTQSIIDALELRANNEGLDKSSIVRKALERELKQELKEIKERG